MMNIETKSRIIQDMKEFEEIQLRKGRELLKNSVELKVEIVETKDDLESSPTKHIFKAIEKDMQIMVLTDEYIGKDNLSTSDHFRLFCDYLKTKEELDLFFDSIEIGSYVVTNNMCGGHYQYGDNPKGEYVKVIFSIYETINGIDREIIFCDGKWFTSMDNMELVGDVCESSRNEYINAFRRIATT